jgi:hypothetical protein
MILNNSIADFKKKLIKTPVSEYIAGVRYVFHHLPKTGGISVRENIRNWFYVCYDYEPNFAYDTMEQATYKSNPWKIEGLKPYNCVCGHYDDPHFILERYPKLFNHRQYRVFTFFREPLSLNISLYYFWKKYRPENLEKGTRLETFLLQQDNRIAKLYIGNCDEDNYKAIVDRYFFVGITEHLQVSIDVLTKKIGRKPLEMEQLNTTKKDQQVEGLDPAVVEKFKINNVLDYLLYDYAVKRFFNEKTEWLKDTKER